MEADVPRQVWEVVARTEWTLFLLPGVNNWIATFLWQPVISSPICGLPAMHLCSPVLLGFYYREV